MNKKLVALTTMSREAIRAIRPGTYADDDLLDLAQYLHQEGDEDRETAVIELILNSPLVMDDVDYIKLHHDVENYYLLQEDYEALPYWALRNMTFDAQSDDPLLEFAGHARDMSQAYMQSDQWATGLAIINRILQYDPHDVWTYLIVGTALLDVDLPRLALDASVRGLALLDKKKDVEFLRKDFLEMQQEAEELQDAPEANLSGADAALIAALRSALTQPLPAELTERQDAYLPPVDRLIGLDQAGDPAVDEEILAAGKVLIPELIHLGLDKNLQKTSRGPWHAARLLNRLRAGPAPELDALANWLDRTDSEDWQEWTSFMIGKIGGYRVDELEAMALDKDLDQVVWAAAIDELLWRTEHQPELRPRLINLLGELFQQPQGDAAEQETFTAGIIGVAVELKALELLPEIEKAFAQDRVDQRLLDQSLVYQQLDLPVPPREPRRSDGLYVWLTCTACERARESFTRFVLIDEPSLNNESENLLEGRSPYIIDHEYTCPKCGAVEQYALPPVELFRLMQLDEEQIADLMANRELKKAPRPHPRVFYIQGEDFGQPMHPLDALAEYQRRIAVQPSNPDLYARMANSLRFIGRFEQALLAYRKAVELDAHNTETLYAAASAEHDFGDLESAHRLYESCLAVGRVNNTSLNYQFDQNVVTSMQGLKALERGQPSPWEYQLINASGKRLLPPAREDFTAHAGEKKDKRAKRHGKRH